MRLIDGDSIQEELAALILYSAGTTEGACVHYAHNLIEAQPTIDAEPVKHAHWILENSRDHDIMKCSACGGVQNDLVYGMRNSRLFKYCPNCGAKMDRERKEK